MNRRDDGGHQGGSDDGGFHAPFGVCSAPSPESSPFVGSGPSLLVQAVDNPEKQLLANNCFTVDVGLDGYIYFMAKDQNGCQFLQQKFEEGKHHVDVIFEGIIDHIADLMTNSFANYLVQKLLDVCDEEQKLRIIAVLTEGPVKLLRISLKTHGGP